MTENEVIELLKNNYPKTRKMVDGRLQGGFDDHECDVGIVIDLAINALEEVQKYRAIGTPEECQKSVEICKSMIERNITPENMEEYMKFEDECVKDGFTFNSLLESREKQTAKKPDYEGDGYSDGQLVYDTWICPCCGQHYEVDYDRYDYCPDCGQHIDWSDEE